MALAGHHHHQQQHHHQPQQQQQHPHHQQPPHPHPTPPHAHAHHIDHQRGITITTLPSTTSVAQHQQQQQQQLLHHGNGSSPHHFNVASLGDLSSAMQLGAVTADGNFVTMNGVVVGRIQHTREELQQLGVIKVESPSNGVTTVPTSAASATQREG
ncbi:GL24689 [Drosophila persimilis]|nr:GL24689 [Drosophila persimilis]